ncbi:MAG: hypothetical protein IJV38_12390 [Prevotella sp.]|nr:hypothetical protein [Prevotella sp.]
MRRLYYRLVVTAVCCLAALTTEAQQVEYFWDKDPGVGNGLVLQQFTGNSATIKAELDVSSLSTGIHQLGIRTLNDKYFSATYYRTVYILPKVHKVSAIEYFFDQDPGVGNGTQKVASVTGDELTMAFDVSTDGLEDGVHKIGIRTLTDGTWSDTKYRQFLVRSVVENYITRVEYFWDDDPGAGNGLAIDITPGEEVNVSFEADMADLAQGTHTLGVRAQSGSGAWSPVTLHSDIEFEGWDALQEYLNSLIDTEDSYANSVYSREYRNKSWHALYVPFSLEYSDWSAHFDIARINAFYQYDDDEDGMVDRQVLEAIIVKPGNGALKPNHPYLIRPKTTGILKLNVAPSKQVAEEINSVSCSTMEAKYTFTGNYADITGLKTASRYRLRGGSLSIPDNDDEVLPPFRWYLTIENLGNQLNETPAGARIGLLVIGDSETTGITQPDGMTEDAARSIYDMQGRKLQHGATPKKGVYIINNKKYVIQ